MRSPNNRENLLDNYPYLSIALVQLLNQQEKKWGYFQIRKKDAYYCLSVPYLPHLLMGQNESNLIYRVYWGYSTYKGTWGQTEEVELEDIIESIKMRGNYRSLKPSVYTKKKSRTVISYKSSDRQPKKLRITEKTQVKQSGQIEKKQRIHEIIISREGKYHSYSSVRTIERLIAILIRDRIEQKSAEIPLDKDEVRATISIIED